jgi:homoserine dehydrogenase
MRPRPVPFNLVLVGFGHVARSFVKLLADRADRLLARHEVSARVVGIATRRHGCVFAPDGLDAARAVSLVDTGEPLSSLAPSGAGAPVRDALDLIDRARRVNWRSPLVVIETTTLNIVDGEPAKSHVLAAFAAGAHVVTANKGPVACAWDEVRDAAARARRQFLFESVVMDGIPVFNLAREALPALDITRLRGIVNTTTNYLLAALEEGRPIADALPAMQAAGIAEADPSLDLEGWDAAAKAAALGNVLMGAHLTPAAVERSGIAHLTPADARSALDAGCRLKLVMQVLRTDQGVRASVGPERLPIDDPLARIHGTMNALTIGTDRLGDLTIVQHGGTVVETAYGIVSDLVSLRRTL